MRKLSKRQTGRRTHVKNIKINANIKIKIEIKIKIKAKVKSNVHVVHASDVKAKGSPS